jgi:hypothetical protein
MADVFLTRTLTGLAASDDAARAALKRWKPGDTIRAKLSKMRNSAHHRKFFAMLKIVYDATGLWTSEKVQLIEVKKAVGHVERVYLSTGDYVDVPMSIDFASMDQTEFEPFYERCLVALCDIVDRAFDEKGSINHDTLRQTVIDELTRNN